MFDPSISFNHRDNSLILLFIEGSSDIKSYLVLGTFGNYKNGNFSITKLHQRARGGYFGAMVPPPVADQPMKFPLAEWSGTTTSTSTTTTPLRQSSWNATVPPVLHSWGSYVGHGGDTYGFLSESGMLSQFNASFSATANQAGPCGQGA